MAFKDNASAVTRLNDYNLRDLGGSASFEVQTISGRGLAPTRDRELQFPGEVGARNYGSFPAVRRIEVTGLLYANTQPDFRIGLDKLKELCRNRIKLNEVLYGEVEAQTLWFADEGVVHEGTAQAGAATTITLDTGASSTDDYYNDMEVEIIGGTGNGQVRKITDYTGSSRVATISPLFATTPDSTSQFWIRDNRYYLVNYSGTMNETRITNQWMRTGYSNVTLPFKAVMPFAVSDWKKQNIASVNGGDFQAIETGTAPSYPRYEIKGGGASSTNPAIVETTTAFQSNFNAAQGTGIANTVITPSVSTGIKHQSGKLNQALELDGSTTAPDKFEVLPKSALHIRRLGGQDSGSIADTLNLNQGTIALWVKRNNDWNTPTISGSTSEYFYANYSTWGSSVGLFNHPTFGLIYFQINDGAASGGNTYVATSSMKAGEWYLIVGRWSQWRTGFAAVSPTAYTHLYIYDSAGSLVGGSGNATQPYRAGMATNIITTSSIGAFYYWVSGQNSANFKGQIDDFATWDRPLSDSEVTALVNGGTGARADSVGSSDLIYYSDFDGTVGTDMVNPIASSNVDTAYVISTDIYSNTVVNGNADKIFVGGDRVVCYDETGYAVHGNVTSTPVSSTIIACNSGSDIFAPVGVYATGTGATYTYWYANDSSDLDVAASANFSFSYWIKTTKTDGYNTVWAKYGSSVGTYTTLLTGKPRVYFWAGAGLSAEALSDTSIADGKWHNVVASVDRSSATGIKLFVDGIECTYTTQQDPTPYTATDLSNSVIAVIGAWQNGAVENLNGSMRDLAFWNDTALTAANALTLATNPISGVGTVGGAKAHWKLTDSSMSTPPSSIGSHTLVNGVSIPTRTQQAYISKNLYLDGGMENGGIGFCDGVYNGTAAKETTTVFKDAQSVALTSGTATSYGYIQSDYPVVGASENYTIRAWVNKGTATNYVGVWVGGNVSGYISIPLSTASGWSFLETSVKMGASDGALDIELLIANNASEVQTCYFDDVKVLPNLINNGGMEGGADPPTGWTATGAVTATSVAAGAAHSGTYSCKMITTAGGGQYIYQAISGLVSDTYYEVSCWVSGLVGGESFSLNVASGGASGTSGTADLTGDWVRKSFTFKTGTVTGSEIIQCILWEDASTAFVDDVSVVHRPDLSPTLTAMSTNYRYEPTRLGMGYHTGGNENMVYSITANKDESAGRIVFRPQFPYDTGSSDTLLTLYGDGTNSITVFYYATGDRWYLEKAAAGVYSYAYSVGQNFSANDEIEIGWYTDPSSGVQIFVNGSASGSTLSANTDSLAINPTTLYLGSRASYTDQTNMIIDDLEILTKSMPAEWFAEQYAKRLASKNQNLYLSYYGTLDTGDILTLDCANTKIVTRAELYDASAGTRTSAINNATIYGSKMPILSERKSMLYFPATISNGVDIHFKKSWQ